MSNLSNSTGCKFRVYDRVLYTQPTAIHCGALPHEGKSGAIVIDVFGGDDSPQLPTYRLRLDVKWGDRYPSMSDENIVVGGIEEHMLTPLQKSKSKSK